MGQEQSSQRPPFKAETSVSQCFHKIGSSDANLPLLRESNVWVGEDLATQPQDEKAPPASRTNYEEDLNQVEYDVELFYCEACYNRGFSDSWTGGFSTRSVVKDGKKIRYMDARHDGAHLTFALGMLNSYRDTRDISFGLVGKDGSIHPDFRLLAADRTPLLFPAQGSHKLVLRPSNTHALSKQQRKLQGLQSALPRSEFDKKSIEADSPSSNRDVHNGRRYSWSSPMMTPILDTIERASSVIHGEEKNPQPSRFSVAPPATTIPMGTPPSHSELRFPVSRSNDGDLDGFSSPDHQSQRHGFPGNWPLSSSASRTESTPSLVHSDQQKSTILTPPTVAPARKEPAPEEPPSNRQTNTENRAIWYKNDAHGADMGENMVFGNAPLRVYPMLLSDLSKPVWFCPESSCNRHFDARRTGPEPYQRANALREHAINEHPPKPLPSTSLFPAFRINRDSQIAIGTVREGFARPESPRVTPAPASQQPVPRPTSVGTFPTEYIRSEMTSILRQAVPPSPASNARQREETDSLLGSDDDDDYDDDNSDDAAIVPINLPSTETYTSPYATMPNSAGPARPLPSIFARIPNSPTAPILQPEAQHGSQKRFGGRACLSCKARKSKCGKERPSCAFCIKRELQCSYPGEGEVTSDSYDNPFESAASVIPGRMLNITASGIGVCRQKAGVRDVEDEDEDGDEDEETLLAELEAMEKEERLKQEQRQKEEEEFARLAEERRKRLADEADLAEYEKNRVKRESVQRLKAEKMRRKAAIAEAEREYEAKREARKRKYEEEHEELMRKKQRADEERQLYERRSSGMR
ncbi:hypothetical protein E2P81_ATG09432 [Venturia nashicola]|nr:hypothetical protein E2P81_ATG09432 [Venturia nashicola]